MRLKRQHDLIQEKTSRQRVGRDVAPVDGREYRRYSRVRDRETQEVRDDGVSRMRPQERDVRGLDARDERERHARSRARRRVQPHHDDSSHASQGVERAHGKKKQGEGRVSEIVETGHADRREGDATQIRGNDATRAVRDDEDVDDDGRDGRETEKKSLGASEPRGVRDARARDGHEMRESREEYRRRAEKVGERNDRRGEEHGVFDERRGSATARRRRVFRVVRVARVAAHVRPVPGGGRDATFFAGGARFRVIYDKR